MIYVTVDFWSGGHPHVAVPEGAEHHERRSITLEAPSRRPEAAREGAKHSP